MMKPSYSLTLCANMAGFGKACHKYTQLANDQCSLLLSSEVQCYGYQIAKR